MEVAVCISRSIVVDDDVYTLHIDTTTEDIRSNEDTLFELLERGVPLDTVRDKSVDAKVIQQDTYRSSCARPE